MLEANTNTSSSRNSETAGRHGRKRKFRHGDWRADLVAAAGEFVGTFMFLLLGLGGIQASLVGSSDDASGATLFAATAMATSLTFTAWIFFRVTGACFNPCVALTLFLVRAISPVRFILYSIAHLLAGLAACAVLAGILPGPLTIACRLSNGTSVVQGFFIEMFLTCFLCFTVCLAAIEKHRATHICAIAIGLALFSTQLLALKFTGASVNTARASGAAAIVGFDSYHWIYWLGPMLGGLLAAAMYKLLLFAHFWEWQGHEDEVPASQAVRYAFSDLTHEQKASAPVTIEMESRAVV